MPDIRIHTELGGSQQPPGSCLSNLNNEVYKRWVLGSVLLLGA